MSRIEAVEPYAIRLPLHLSGGGRTEECFLLRIVTEDGLEGWGEAHGSPYLSRAAIDAPTTHVTAQGLRALLVGQDASDIAALRHRMEKGTQWIGRDGAVMQAIAAAELALWDLAGHRARLPVARLLHDAPRMRLPCYASDKVAATPALTERRIAAERAAGFVAHKIGWPPFGQSEEGDVAFLEAARRAAPDATLMVDAAQAFDEATALARARAFERFGLAWIEEPLDRDDLEGQARLKQASPVPIASGEGECGLPGLMRVVPLVDVLQADITRCGILAAQAASRHVPQVCSHSFTTPLNVAMHAHWLAATPNSWFVEWPIAKIAIWQPFFRDGPCPVEGVISLGEQPGWGVRPDLPALTGFLIPAAG
ncbi:mandelate racemase [Gluconacetobacter johannae DSM 13595]|uniref:Mandelate racemase/muconate lactonizing enzyme family protein n=1 Tax=Gluconacetobacter johannae TaxID=112140 RepID=A0A7W4J5N3_9PROT|nr:mandelate racemase/muconate lactonizing enzyme family protein [Gluconacetobacter johannae]MBB2175203.1 mandelate racemase/muconate lactonizing enzyme family protein [Gluconacetobacter johannae]GBQ80625.1 mandelate racemase [Gluconacetobacter johannae DSM 13595]